MPTRIPSHPPAAPLPESLVRRVLLGWTVDLQVDTLPEWERDALFDLWQNREAGCARLWRQHERWLRAEAQRLGITPAWPMRNRRRGFFGEACAAQEGGNR
jgi:hypothetical protein